MNKLNDFLQSMGCFSVKHSGRTLGDHLVGTYILIKRFGGSESTAVAGALHSIYGTNAFQTSTLDYSSRADLAARFGARAEYLAYVFSRINRPREIESGQAHDRETKLRIDLCTDDLRDLRLIEAANLLDQKISLSRYPNIAAEAELASPQG